MSPPSTLWHFGTHSPWIQLQTPKSVLQPKKCSRCQLGKPSWKKNFLSGIARITSPPTSPQFGQHVPLFLDVKNDVLSHITEPSNDDYDNGVSDNCDQNFGTFDDFGVRNDQKV